MRAEQAEVFDRLIEKAAEVVTMPFESAGREAYEAANAELLTRADRLVAVWNGQPPGGRARHGRRGVEARAAGIPVDVVWPAGAARMVG